MPTYEYECPACGHRFDAFQSITAKPLKKCPECNQRQLQRLIGTGAGIIFRGSGFYETDYRSEEYKKAAKAEKESTSGSDKKGDDTTGGKKPAKKGDKAAAKAKQSSTV
jgi:putative FmdB family regulatory protein